MKPTSMEKIIPVRDMFCAHRDHYDNGGSDYSITTLLNPPRVVHLEKRHMHKVTPTIQQTLASFMGTAMHDYGEQMLYKSAAYQENINLYTCEERLRIRLLDRDISGAYDILMRSNGLHMYDLKTTKCMTMVRNRGCKSDWTSQQNMYNYLYFKEHGVMLDSLNIIGLFWDWSPYGLYSLKEKWMKTYYPRKQIVQYPLKMWPLQATEDFIKAHLQQLIACEDLDDDKLPACTSDDMWADPDKWAVKLNGKARALTAQCMSKKEAEEYVANHNYNNDTRLSDYSIEFRPAFRRRCEEWCPVNKYCNQWHEYNSGGK